jgi:hypothetical protein
MTSATPEPVRWRGAGRPESHAWPHPRSEDRATSSSAAGVAGTPPRHRPGRGSNPSGSVRWIEPVARRTHSSYPSCSACDPAARRAPDIFGRGRQPSEIVPNSYERSRHRYRNGVADRPIPVACCARWNVGDRLGKGSTHPGGSNTTAPGQLVTRQWRRQADKRAIQRAGTR